MSAISNINVTNAPSEKDWLLQASESGFKISSLEAKTESTFKRIIRDHSPTFIVLIGAIGITFVVIGGIGFKTTTNPNFALFSETILITGAIFAAIALIGAGISLKMHHSQ